MSEIATLAGGCFWCLEAVFDDVAGVDKVVSGYMGGHVANPSYDQVCGKKTGHAEVVQISFDPAVVSYRDLLEIFFEIHDPTTKDRQGNDVGPQYRSAIFAHDDAQMATAREVVADLAQRRVFGSPIVTELVAAAPFWPAEIEHHDYYARVGNANPYCAFVISPKVAKFRKKFAHHLKNP